MRKRRDVIQRYMDAVYETEVAQYERKNMCCFVYISCRREQILSEMAVLRLNTWYSYGDKGKVYIQRCMSRRQLLEFEKPMGLQELAKLEVEAAVRDIMRAGAYPVGGEWPYPVKQPDEYRIRKEDCDD